MQNANFIHFALTGFFAKIEKHDNHRQSLNFSLATIFKFLLAKV